MVYGSITVFDICNMKKKEIFSLQVIMNYSCIVTGSIGEFTVCNGFPDMLGKTYINYMVVGKNGKTACAHWK